MYFKGRRKGRGRGRGVGYGRAKKAKKIRQKGKRIYTPSIVSFKKSKKKYCICRNRILKGGRGEKKGGGWDAQKINQKYSTKRDISERKKINAKNVFFPLFLVRELSDLNFFLGFFFSF